MAQLQCKTLGGVSPRGKARVYFACHPEDHKGYFQEVTDQILKLCDCAIYYYEEEPEQNDEYYVNLERMQLFVMPVTTRLLYLPNRAMDVEFRYAMEHHIPVLPLMQEQGLEEKYAEKFGNLQFLDKGNRDLTAIPYEEKLKKYLDAVLLNDELTAQVRAAFDAWIFLSYRKKDRKAAQELMRLIHSDPRCRDIAIWYDEFLNPGEDFNDAIRKALAESQLFVLAVTPNLLEAGNYVMREEYPEARKAGKPILPAEMEKTDREAFRDGFPGVPDPLDPGADGMVSGAVLDALGALAVRENDEDSKHIFFIGLAYLSGLFVEKDRQHAVKLITQAAEAGLTEAMEKLVNMYETGEGVERNYETAARWQEKLVDQARFAYEKYGTAEAADHFLSAILTVGDTWKSLDHLERAKAAYRTHCDLAEKLSKRGDLRYLRNLSLSYERLGSIADVERAWSEAKKWYKMSLDISCILQKESISGSLRDVFVCCIHLGDVARADGDAAGAKERYLQAMDICKEMGTEEGAFVLRETTICYNRLGCLAFENGELDEAENWYLRALEIMLDGAEIGTEQAQLDLYLCYSNLGDIAFDRKQYAVVKKWYLTGMPIIQNLSQNGKIRYLRLLSSAYNKLAQAAFGEDDIQDAVRWFSCRLENSKVIAKMSTAAEDYDELSDAYFKLGACTNDISLLKEGLEIDLRLLRDYPDQQWRQQNVQAARDAIRQIEEFYGI